MLRARSLGTTKRKEFFLSEINERSAEAPSWLAHHGELGDARNAAVRVQSISLGSNNTLELEPYGVTAIVGANNSGKSTLLRQLRSIIDSGPQALAYEPIRMVTSVKVATSGNSGDFLAWLVRNAHYTPPGPGQYGNGNLSYGNHSIELDSAVAQWNALDEGQSLAQLAPFFVFSADGNSRFQYSQGSGARQEGTAPPSEPLHRFQDNRALFLQLNDLSKRVFNQELTLDDSGMTLRIRMGRSDARVPRLDESRRAYAEALSQLSPLDTQGDGVKAFLSLFIPLVAATYSIVIVDEPEVFLHPPQAFAAGKAIGEIAAASKVQVILATHDKDFLAGVLSSDAPLRIARLQRTQSQVSIRTIPAVDLRTLWEERLLRYGNVLSGLFHRLVVVCEGDQDCHFYQAALEDYISAAAGSVPIAATDVLFVPTNGKAAMAQVARVVSAAGVPTVIVPDLDVLDDSAIISRMVRALGGDWDKFASDFSAVTTPIRRRNSAVKVDQLRRDLDSYLDGVLAGSSEVFFTPDHKENIDRIMRTSESDWAMIKVAGIAAFRGQQREAADRLLAGLSELGIVPVEEGTLESFAPTFAKNRNWLPRALESGAHRTAPAKKLISKILEGRFDSPQST